MDELFSRYDELVRRDRWHRPGHNQMVQGLAEKWSGEQGVALDFARRTSAEAPEGLPVHTVLGEAHAEEDVQAVHVGRATSDYWQSAGVAEDIRLAEQRSLQSPAYKVCASTKYDHNVFAYCYWQLGDTLKAREHFDALGPYATEDWWGLKTDPTAHFAAARNAVMLGRT
jgi:hypothetical protein